MRLVLICVLLSAYGLPFRPAAQQTVTFPAKDGLTVTADLFQQNKESLYIVLCHLDFIPVGKGAHGAIALWKVTPNHAEYWMALEAFLKQLKL